MILHTGTTGIGTGRKPRASGDDPEGSFRESLKDG